MEVMLKLLENFERALLEWYARNGRSLPWRETKDPYKVWVSEIMLQQTQVDRVRDYYARFLERFPNVESLARAEWEEVLEQWRGLGYYRRARSLHAAARAIMDELGGIFPAEFDVLVKLPGIGNYTAGALCCFAFGQDVPAIDTNVEQVFAHVYGEPWIDMNPGQKRDFVAGHISKGNGASFHHALMDLGTALKRGGKCPFHARCEGIVARRARTIRKSSRSAIPVVAGVLIHEGKVLIARRRLWDSNGGKWEFPGGKLEQGEDRRAALKREMMEELGVEVAVRPHFYRMEIEYRGKLFDATFHRCSLLLGDPQPLAAEELAWITADELDEYDFLSGNKQVFPIMREKKAMWRV